MSVYFVRQEESATADEKLHAGAGKGNSRTGARPWRTMFAIAAYVGLRAGEILGLSVEDVDLERGRLNVRKTAWYGHIQTAKSVAARTQFRFPKT